MSENHSQNFHSGEQYEEIVHNKLNDKQMRKNLKSAMGILKKNRKNTIANRYTNWEELRELGRKVKQNALANLPTLLENFERNATKNGFKVHWAKDSKEANEIILSLMQKNNANVILKGKSMASEEIGLNHYLKDNGINAIETDLGELIIQLIDEPPVHIVAPAIHKNRYEIGEIFKDKLNAPLESEPEKLNNIARTHLRKEFKDFRIGLSGVNFAIANEGAIWLIENEGNGRMSTTACDIHIAICGIEKIVESFEDASILDLLLVPSATGANISCYNNIIASPRQEGELDGPKEVHIILLDNNRSKILADSHYYRALSCIRCGTCLNHCPVYDKIGGHSYLSTYPGPIGEVISPQIFGLNNCAPMLNFCSLCERCSEVCPVKIPLASLIRDLRSEKAGEGRGGVVGYKETHRSSLEKNSFAVFTSFATSGFKWRLLITQVRIFGGLGKAFGGIIPGLKQWLSCRSYPALDASLHSKVKNLKGVIYE
ncbi:iron-sulfur cluster-binding protein [Helicobacter sp. 16-1353]|uniref:LutB/LldF family L-lactate oxidation iron-sulfur protein n=1 Tax=Helicobacter sp. 16-1353 TaxID=2004996 RepID=UPI000DCE83AA|nr:LutB/LldF family L-lactate oxidation iron-sulfur protein [Helicobacter sp. 16-1353]RAX54064.1 iron-sulfur cluster-binding protein [Helicobacter sp. 16-1353]